MKLFLQYKLRTDVHVFGAGTPVPTDLLTDFRIRYVLYYYAEDGSDGISVVRRQRREPQRTRIEYS